MNVHPDCESIAFLLGTWKGAGAGDYPTIQAFQYNEEVTFAHVGKPFLSYSQKTVAAETGQPLHAECGYLRGVGSDRVELVVVQPSGIVELHSGSVAGHAIELVLDAVHTTPTAKTVSDVRREIEVQIVDGRASLVYDVSMAAVGTSLTHHLHAELLRQPS